MGNDFMGRVTTITRLMQLELVLAGAYAHADAADDFDRMDAMVRRMRCVSTRIREVQAAGA